MTILPLVNFFRYPKTLFIASKCPSRGTMLNLLMVCVAYWISKHPRIIAKFALPITSESTKTSFGQKIWRLILRIFFHFTRFFCMNKLPQVRPRRSSLLACPQNSVVIYEVPFPAKLHNNYQVLLIYLCAEVLFTWNTTAELCASDFVVVDQPRCVTQAYFAQWTEIRIPQLVQL